MENDKVLDKIEKMREEMNDGFKETNDHLAQINGSVGYLMKRDEEVSQLKRAVDDRGARIRAIETLCEVRGKRIDDRFSNAKEDTDWIKDNWVTLVFVIINMLFSVAMLLLK